MARLDQQDQEDLPVQVDQQGGKERAVQEEKRENKVVVVCIRKEKQKKKVTIVFYTLKCDRVVAFEVIIGIHICSTSSFSTFGLFTLYIQ